MTSEQKLTAIAIAIPFIILVLGLIRSWRRVQRERSATKKHTQDYIAYFDAKHSRRLAEEQVRRIDAIAKEIKKRKEDQK